MRRWLDILLDLFVPATCEVCDEPLRGSAQPALCDACLAAVSPLPPPLCSACGVPLGGSVEATCPPCRTTPPTFVAARAVGLYVPSGAGGNVLARAVQRLKYDRRRALAGVLGGLMAARYPFAPDAVLVPVPLHPRRLRARGFNQAELLAAEVARHRGLAVLPAALVRPRATTAQPGLTAAARRLNLQGAFRVARREAIGARAVVLIDDVLTTGATADACARALRAAGVRRVDVYTLGRAPARAGALDGPSHRR